MKLFESVIDEEQLHFNFIDSVGGHIEKLGASYLAHIAEIASSTGLQPSGFAVSEEGE
jgi:bacterioferritin